VSGQGAHILQNDQWPVDAADSVISKPGLDGHHPRVNCLGSHDGECEWADEVGGGGDTEVESLSEALWATRVVVVEEEGMQMGGLRWEKRALKLTAGILQGSCLAALISS
jgi:hypothetical protein